MSLYFIPPAFSAICAFLLSKILTAFHEADSKVNLDVIFLIAGLFVLYLGLAGILALLWTISGKEIITISANEVQVKKVLIFTFSSRNYRRDKMRKVYVNSEDHLHNPVSKGRNDFLAVFRLGTIHFEYEGKLQHIAGGMTDHEGEILMDKLLPVDSN